MAIPLRTACLCGIRLLPLRIYPVISPRPSFSTTKKFWFASTRQFSQVADQPVKKHANIGTIGHVDHGKEEELLVLLVEPMVFITYSINFHLFYF